MISLSNSRSLRRPRRWQFTISENERTERSWFIKDVKECELSAALPGLTIYMMEMVDTDFEPKPHGITRRFHAHIIDISVPGIPTEDNIFTLGEGEWLVEDPSRRSRFRVVTDEELRAIDNS